MITPTSSTVNSGVSVGNVPADGGAGCLRAKEPAMARAGTMSRKRPTSMQSPRVVLYQSVLPARPPNAEPLLFDADVNAYTTSESPCAPGLRIDAFALSSTTDAPANARITAGTARM